MSDDGSSVGLFDRFATRVAHWSGHAVAFSAALLVTLAWGASGPLFHFSDTWQLIINTGTTLITFLMVFIIQNTLNRDSSAVHLKLDELIRVSTEARDALIGSEKLGEKAIEELKDQEEAGTAPPRARRSARGGQRS